MNAASLKDFLAAAAACDPKASFAGPLKLVAAAARQDEWEIGVCAADAALLSLASRSPGGPEGVWNSKLSRWLRAPKARAVPTRPAKPFSPSLFEEPIASALATFDELVPVEKVLFAPGRPCWSLILAAPPAWPQFLRCDLAAGFAPRAAELSLLLRDARVVALEFDGNALWARVVGG